MKNTFGKDQATFCVNVFEKNQIPLTQKTDMDNTVSMKTVICALNNQLHRDHFSNYLLFFSGLLSLIIVFASQFDATAIYISLGIFFLFLLWKLYTISGTSPSITFSYYGYTKEQFLSRYVVLKNAIEEHSKTGTLSFQNFVPFANTPAVSPDDEKNLLKPDFLFAFPSIKMSDCTVYIVPVGIISISKKGYSFFQFDEKNFCSVSTKNVKTSDAPLYRNAKQIEQHYLHMRKNGTPDLRYSYNPLYITYEYGVLNINLHDNGQIEFIFPSKKLAEVYKINMSFEPPYETGTKSPSLAEIINKPNQPEAAAKIKRVDNSEKIEKKYIEKPLLFSFSRDYKNTASIAFLNSIALKKTPDILKGENEDFHYFYWDEIAPKVFNIYWCQLEIGNIPASISDEYFPLIEYIKHFRINYYRLLQTMKIRLPDFEIWKENSRKYLSGMSAFDYDRLQINIIDIMKKIAFDEFSELKFKGKVAFDFSNPLAIGVQKGVYVDHFQNWSAFFQNVKAIWSDFFEKYQVNKELTPERKGQIERFLALLDGDYLFGKLPVPESPMISTTKDKNGVVSLSDVEKQVLSKLDKDYYTKDTFLKLLVDLGVEKKNIPEKNLIETFGFYLFSENLVLNKKWHNFVSLMKSKALSDSLFEVDPTISNMDFYQTGIRNMVKQGYLIKADEFTYLTKRALINEGISEVEIGLFCQEVKHFSQDHEFFSIKQISTIGISKITTSQNKQILIDNFVSKMPDIQSVSFSEGKLFSFSNRQISRVDYVKTMMLGKTSMDAYDFIYNLKKEHGVIYKIDALIRDINAAQMYYNEDTEKIYIDKKTFIQEVFGNV